MPIVGLTHEKDGSARIHRTVSCKVAIGLAPDEQSNYPKKLDHFAFLKLEMVGREMKWVVDEEKQEHYGDKCKAVWILFFDNDPDTIFRTEMAAFVKTKCWCRGDGEKAQRRKKVDGQYKGDFEIWDGPCANHGCPDAESQNGKPAACKPSGDLYFMLQDFPTLGTICRIHTSSYQSIRQISSALRDLQAVTGGRLMGIACKLFVMPAKSVFVQAGQEKTGTKFVLGLELAARDMPQLMDSMSKTAGMFMGLQKQLKGAVLEVEEEDDELRAGEIAAEFYPEQGQPEPQDPEAALRARADELLRENYPQHNTAQRIAMLGRYSGRMQELIDRLSNDPEANKCRVKSEATETEPSRSSSAGAVRTNASSAGNRQPSSATTQPKTERAATSRSAAGAQSTPAQTRTTAPRTKANAHGVEITDDDFPEGMFTDEPELRPLPPAARKGERRGFNF
jgi:hypothetical protein